MNLEWLTPVKFLLSLSFLVPPFLVIYEYCIHNCKYNVQNRMLRKILVLSMFYFLSYDTVHTGNKLVLLID